VTASTSRNKVALQQIYAKLNQDQGALGFAVAAYKRISESTLFDETYYQMRYPDIADLGMEPLAHYILHGSNEGRSTHPLFDGLHYKQILKQKDIKVRNSLRHYLEHGKNAGFDPNVLFDTAYVLSQTTANENALELYLKSDGTTINPHPLFDGRYYLHQNSSVKEAGLNPLVHFVLVGAFEGRWFHPLFHPQCYLEDLGIKLLPKIDISTSDEPLKQLYQVAQKEVWTPAGSQVMNPLLHYLEYGGKENRNPHPIFSTQYYLENNPSVKSSGLNPLIHYIQDGESARLKPHILFDPNFYLSQIEASEAEKISSPLSHYYFNGWKQGLRPHPDFNPTLYLDIYKHVKESGQEPLEHYLRATEEQEGRIPNESFDGEFYRSVYADVKETSLTALEHYLMYGAKERRVRNFFELVRKRGIDHGFNPDSVDISTIKLEQVADPIATVLLIGKTTQENMARSLSALARQSAERIEIISVGAETEFSTFANCGIKMITELDKAVDAARGRYLIFLKKNMVVLNDWLDAILKHVENTAAGIGYSQIVTPLGRIKSAGYTAGENGSIQRNDAYYNLSDSDRSIAKIVDFGGRDCMTIEKRLFWDVGGFGNDLKSELVQDAQLAQKVADKGHQNWCEPVSKVVALGEYTTAHSQKEPIDAIETPELQKLLSILDLMMAKRQVNAK